MIIKGGSCSGPGRLAAHLLRTDHNEHVRVAELRGTAAADLPGTLADLAALAAGTQCRRPLYHASLNSRADEVRARTAGLCACIAAEFSGRIGLARTTLPRDHVAAAVAALKQAKRETVKFVRESAASEVNGRNKIIRRRWVQLKRLHVGFTKNV